MKCDFCSQPMTEIARCIIQARDVPFVGTTGTATLPAGGHWTMCGDCIPNFDAGDWPHVMTRWTRFSYVASKKVAAEKIMDLWTALKDGATICVDPTHAGDPGHFMVEGDDCRHCGERIHFSRLSQEAGDDTHVWQHTTGVAGRVYCNYGPTSTKAEPQGDPCPGCGVYLVEFRDQVEHMRANHPEIIANRLRKAGYPRTAPRHSEAK